uniref:Uncharacterized protein n=1 Tax=Bicosoecida sp. CB-2014 TaxID=1486930 RepID=A0A7S1CM92_9STRA|mmetsp:Transcript_3987/g.14832  ORF Transcript_3987/g.14832 Transcript_3987/m.14832 type:complete len:647 (+) Transcript_3987:116-2056(+)
MAIRLIAIGIVCLALAMPGTTVTLAAAQSPVEQQDDDSFNTPGGDGGCSARIQKTPFTADTLVTASCPFYAELGIFRYRLRVLDRDDVPACGAASDLQSNVVSDDQNAWDIYSVDNAPNMRMVLRVPNMWSYFEELCGKEAFAALVHRCDHPSCGRFDNVVNVEVVMIGEMKSWERPWFNEPAQLITRSIIIKGSDSVLYSTQPVAAGGNENKTILIPYDFVGPPVRISPNYLTADANAEFIKLYEELQASVGKGKVLSYMLKAIVASDSKDVEIGAVRGVSNTTFQVSGYKLGSTNDLSYARRLGTSAVNVKVHFIMLIAVSTCGDEIVTNIDYELITSGGDKGLHMDRMAAAIKCNEIGTAGEVVAEPTFSAKSCAIMATANAEDLSCGIDISFAARHVESNRLWENTLDALSVFVSPKGGEATDTVLYDVYQGGLQYTPVDASNPLSTILSLVDVGRQLINWIHINLTPQNLYAAGSGLSGTGNVGFRAAMRAYLPDRLLSELADVSEKKSTPGEKLHHMMRALAGAQRSANSTLIVECNWAYERTADDAITLDNLDVEIRTEPARIDGQVTTGSASGSASGPPTPDNSWIVAAAVAGACIVVGAAVGTAIHVAAKKKKGHTSATSASPTDGVASPSDVGVSV